MQVVSRAVKYCEFCFNAMEAVECHRHVIIMVEHCGFIVCIHRDKTFILIYYFMDMDDKKNSNS